LTIGYDSIIYTVPGTGLTELTHAFLLKLAYRYIFLSLLIKQMLPCLLCYHIHYNVHIIVISTLALLSSQRHHKASNVVKNAYIIENH